MNNAPALSAGQCIERKDEAMTSRANCLVTLIFSLLASIVIIKVAGWWSIAIYGGFGLLLMWWALSGEQVQPASKSYGPMSDETVESIVWLNDTTKGS